MNPVRPHRIHHCLRKCKSSQCFDEKKKKRVHRKERWRNIGGRRKEDGRRRRRRSAVVVSKWKRQHRSGEEAMARAATLSGLEKGQAAKNPKFTANLQTLLQPWCSGEHTVSAGDPSGPPVQDPETVGVSEIWRTRSTSSQP
ncbi:hypothetical protein C4D60_Mb03t04010 [Musa balbisiana]|uniref:Uncharacterized protein n=1 Tax=Musa balbisiana TaxID=52838 RepID=A0A4S8J7D1_MUSBA|nr:hypothetical protein C4D60_Mb03t04010 [Musa balbisiana]